MNRIVHMEVIYGQSFVEGDYEDYEIQSEEVEGDTKFLNSIIT